MGRSLREVLVAVARSRIAVTDVIQKRQCFDELIEGNGPASPLQKYLDEVGRFHSCDHPAAQVGPGELIQVTRLKRQASDTVERPSLPGGQPTQPLPVLP